MNEVITLLAQQGVRTSTTDNHIVAVPSFNAISTVLSTHRIVPATGPDYVVPPSRSYFIITFKCFDDVSIITAGEDVVTARSVDISHGCLCSWNRKLEGYQAATEVADTPIRDAERHEYKE